MKPRHSSGRGGPDWGRRHFLRSASAGMMAAALGAGGCTSPAIRPQSPDEGDTAGSPVRLVGDLAVPFGMHPVRIEAVGLVTGLPGTGSDPGPSPQRDELIDEMKKRGVPYPNQVLASPTTELVLVRGYLRPGIQKGDHFDVELRVPSRSEASSLRGGRLMETRLKEMAVLDGRIRGGKVLALAQGAILVDPAAEGEDDRIKLTRGRILGGGVAMEARKMGLVLKPDNQNVMVSGQIGAAINRRFHMFSAGIKQGVANPQNDKYIALDVHPRYKDNIARYVQVLRALSVRETAAQQQSRLALLERQLLDPITSSAAALRLEAVGKDAVKALLKGIEADQAEVRFYAAEALAYLDQSEAIAALAEATGEPAFRPYALAALSAMDDFSAYEALAELLSVDSAETRYGAFRALWAMNSLDPLVRGENLGDQFSYHLLDTQGPPMVHVTRSHRPEIVLFGPKQRLAAPTVLEAGKKIMINARDDANVTVSRFAANEPDQKRVVTTSLDEIIRAVVELGGTYPDVVQALQQAKASRALTSRLAIDALPAAGRTYERSDGEEEAEASEVVVGNPLPALFGGSRGRDPEQKKAERVQEEKPAPKKSLFGKITSRGR
ncbi:MAG: flagellar basal body P-ring protein FlgI [Pirellulales bacterium]